MEPDVVTRAPFRTIAPVGAAVTSAKIDGALVVPVREIDDAAVISCSTAMRGAVAVTELVPKLI
jgi:hypothetical protein